MCLQAAQSRLDALEQDNPDDAADVFGVDEDDDEFVMAESSDDGGSNPPHQQKQNTGRTAGRKLHSNNKQEVAQHVAAVHQLSAGIVQHLVCHHN